MNPERYKLIEEYVVYAGGSENFPPYPPKDKQEALKALEFFIGLEKKRHEVIQALEGEPYIMVMDRSIISLMGFRYAQKHLGGIDIFRETKEILKDHLELAPDFVIYLKATDEQINERQFKSQRPVGELFIDPEFNKHLRKFFDWLQEQKAYPIVTVDTGKPFELIKQEVTTIADGLST